MFVFELDAEAVALPPVATVFTLGLLELYELEGIDEAPYEGPEYVEPYEKLPYEGT